MYCQFNPEPLVNEILMIVFLKARFSLKDCFTLNHYKVLGMKRKH